jgi:hypothetical protein
VAAGGRVLFVDHDPARLAGHEHERWHFDGKGQVSVLAGPAPRSGPRPRRVTVAIETAVAPEVVADRLRAIDGVRVLSVDVAPGGGGAEEGQ